MSIKATFMQSFISRRPTMLSVTIARSWCQEHWANCFFCYNDQTGENTHIGHETAQAAQYMKALEKQGFWFRHRAGVYTGTCWKTTLALPLDWQIMESQHDQIDPYQDW
jgi:hypothetical protein